MAIRAFRFKPGAAILHHGPRLVRAGFPCNRPARIPAGPRKPTRNAAMIDQEIEIPTRDGHTTTFISHPERDGPHPVILFFMDAPGIREELRDMARRLATSGYYVVLPNMYYRAHVMEIGPIPPEEDAPERKRMAELMFGLNIPLVMQDTQALLDFIATQPAASKGPIGCLGYCMSGQYAINAAATFPDRVAAAASIYGTHLMTDKPDSPHKVARNAKAELYFACAEFDRWAPLEMIEPLRSALNADNVQAEVELCPGVHHGFAFPKRPVYNKDAAERHWERLLALYRRRLQS
jgi:carboxymethylenebutenolidase